MKNNRWLRLLLLPLFLLPVSVAFAAFCSLRDPVAAITELYGEQVTYRSIVSSITNADRMAVKQRLPFTLHRSEVGKHTLYVVYRGESAEGFVQARSELARWGLMEIAWSIRTDMTIGGFFYQRCRGSVCRSPAMADLHSLLAGKNFNQLQALLTDDGNQLRQTDIHFPDELSDIALLTIRSALKTIAITEISWSLDAGKVQ